ncbi:MAG: DnaD domain protein [Proteocatella sp.]
MFFQEKIEKEKRETSIPNTFFEQILPIITPLMLKIYLYAYYLSKNQETDEKGFINTNEQLAEKLEVSLDEVLSSWDFFESCGLIIKHRINEEQAQSFSVEFKNLQNVGLSSAPVTVSTDELLVAYQNEEYKKMYDQIEQTTQLPLMHFDMTKINEFIKQYNVPKDLIVESVKFNLYRKKSKAISSALGILRNWYLDGIRSTEDLDTMLRNKEKRYLEYKKILANFGEYRLPTKPEEDMMDVWLDEYKFSLEVIESALSKTTAIKSPNMNYLNGILKNWNEKLQENESEKKLNIETNISDTKNEKEPGTFMEDKENKEEFREKVFRVINFTRKSMTKQEIDSLNFLYEHYHSDDVELAAKWLKEKNKNVTLENICRILLDPSMNDEQGQYGKSYVSPTSKKPVEAKLVSKQITLQDIKEIDKKKTFKNAAKSNSKVKIDPQNPNEMDEIERKLQKRLFERLAKKEKEKNQE